MIKVATIVGARPQFVKGAVVSRALRATPGLSEVIIHTGQHYDEYMSGRFFEDLDIPKPDYHLSVSSARHGGMTGEMLAGVEDVLLNVRPDCVVVFGDTNTTLAGALAAAKLGIPIAHVEAGLRSFNRAMPEEINRVVTDHVAKILFAPTEIAQANLLREGIAAERVHLVGDVMYDAAIQFRDRARSAADILRDCGMSSHMYGLVTLHRAENTASKDVMNTIICGLAGVADDLPLVWPVHPRTRAALAGFGLDGAARKVASLIAPVGYLDMLGLEYGASVIITDSGGVQKEAYFARRPCVTLRGETEWTELVQSGVNRLVPPLSAHAIVEAVRFAIGSEPEWPMLYGHGRASAAIAKALASTMG